MDRGGTPDKLRVRPLDLEEGLVIFDLDGTLIQTATVTVPAVREGFEGFSLPVPNSTVILDFIGKPASALTRWVRGTCPAKSVDRLHLAFPDTSGERRPA